MQVLQTFFIEGDTAVAREPDITFDGENYLAVWSAGEFGGGSNIRCARITPSGVVLDTGILCGMDHYCEYHPAIAFDGNRSLVVWYNYVDPPAGVYARFVGRDGVPVGREITIRFLPENTDNDPAIAFLDSVYLVVWSEPSPNADDDIYGQIVLKDGALYGTCIPIATGSIYQCQPRICALDSMFVVVWSEFDVIRGQFVSIDGTLTGNNFHVSSPIERPRDFPDIAYQAGQCLAVWHEFINDDHEIYGNLDVNPWVQEAQEPQYVPHRYIPTIMAHTIDLYHRTGHRIYDILGREILSQHPAPGIYFIEHRGEIVSKIVLIR